MDSGARDKDDSWRGLSRRSSAVTSLMLVIVLLISALAMIITPTSGTDPVGRRSESASVDPNSLTLTASPTRGYVGYNVTFYANGSSYNPGATLTITIFYDYYLSDFSVNPESPVTVNTTTSPAFVMQTHVYNQLGNFTDTEGSSYWVVLFVDDGESNETIAMQFYVSIYVPPVNQPPWVVLRPLCPPGARRGEPQSMQAIVQDNQSDPITMFWDFGDGTNATNYSATSPVTFRQVHTWTPPIIGDGMYNATYYLNTSYTDGLHPSVNFSSIASIQVPFYISPTVQVTWPDPPIVQGKPTPFAVNASAYYGDPITWTFNYSDGYVEVFHTNATAPQQLIWQNATHTFASTGSYLVSISVTDSVVPYQTGDHNQTISLTLNVLENSPPTVFPIDMSPGAPRINETIGYVNVTFTVQAFDPEGEIITLTWDFGGGNTRTNVSSGGKDLATYIQVVQFDETGNFTISLTVTDGIPGHEVVVTRYANITSDNRAPVLVLFDKGQTIQRDFAMPNETVNITIILSDREHDPLDVTLDFGDNSTPMKWTNLTDYVNGNITLLVSHVYTEKGKYTATLVVTDNKIGRYNHTLTFVLPIDVDVPRVVIHHGWDWWDYTSLGLFLMIPVLAIAWTLENRRRRKQIEEQGMTYDEWKLMKEVKAEGLDK